MASASDDVAGGRGDASRQEVSNSQQVPDCAVCLQPCLHPVKLECLHIFCFLCVKGVAATQPPDNKTCPMCRRQIPRDFFANPNLLQPVDKVLAPAEAASEAAAVTTDQSDSQTPEPKEPFKWFYHGRSGGWWEYDPRTADDLEKAYQKHSISILSGQLSNVGGSQPPTSDAVTDAAAVAANPAAEDGEGGQEEEGQVTPPCELLIAGFLYSIDFGQMIQYRCSDPNRKRMIKRDIIANVDNYKGIAGLRLPNAAATPTHAPSGQTNNNSQRDGVSAAPPLTTAATRQHQRPRLPPPSRPPQPAFQATSAPGDTPQPQQLSSLSRPPPEARMSDPPSATHRSAGSLGQGNDISVDDVESLVRNSLTLSHPGTGENSGPDNRGANL